jgi:hypothetical protein
MKIEVGKTYINKATKQRVIVNSIENGKVAFAQVATPGQSVVRSVRDFALKYKQAGEVRKRRSS